MAKVLAVDDDSHIRRFVEETLGEAGHEVVTVGDAESAFAQVLSERPDLFLLDINLPGMNGLALAQKLQEQRGTRATPVVVFSVRTDPQDKRFGGYPVESIAEWHERLGLVQPADDAG